MAYRPKEACIIIFDATLSEESQSQLFPHMSKFQLGKKVADHYLRRFLQENRKTDQVGIIVGGMVGEESEGANEICMLQSSSIELRKKLDEIKPIENSDCDLVDAFNLAMDKIQERVKHYKFQRTIAIVTDGASVKSESSLRTSRDDFFASSDLVKVEILGIDFNEKGRPSECEEGQQILEKVFGKEMIQPITQESAFKPRKRHVGQVKKWNGALEISQYCKFHVIMVARIAEEKLKSLEKRSKVALEMAEADGGAEAAEEMLHTGGAPVQMNRSYYSSEDPDREVPPEERAKGFRYGKDIVPSFPGDEEAMQLEDREQCLKVIGIIDRSELLRSYMISSTSCIVANPDAPNSQEGFSAFVRAMKDLDKVATCRYVRKTGTNPKFVALIPGVLPEGSSATGSDCLWHVQIPTMEDIRDYPFESLDRFKPNDTEKAVAMSFVRAMTLKEGDARESQRYDPEHTFNPVIARYWEAVHAKALEPDRPIPAASPYVTAMITPDPDVIKRSNKALTRISKTFPLKRVVRRRDRGTGMDVVAGTSTAAPAAADQQENVTATATEDGAEDWFVGEQKSIVDYVSATTPVEDMWAMLEQSTAGGRDRSADAFRGITEVLRGYVGPDGDRIYYEKALTCLKAFREAALKYHGERAFNECMVDLKQGLLNRNSDQEFWRMICDAKVSLITADDSHDVEEISQKDAEEFLSSTEMGSITQKTTQSAGSQARDVNEDVFDEME